MKKCKNCRKNRVKSKERIFCSHKCKVQYAWSEKRRGCFMLCCNCGKPIWIPLRYFSVKTKGKYNNIKEGKFCNAKCFAKFRETEIPFWLENGGFKKGNISWNTGKKLSKEFSDKCKVRAVKQWKDLSFREKQMKRDFSKLSKLGTTKLNEYYKNHKRIGTTKNRKNFMNKIGVKYGRN